MNLVNLGHVGNKACEAQKSLLLLLDTLLENEFLPKGRTPYGTYDGHKQTLVRSLDSQGRGQLGCTLNVTERKMKH